MRLLIKEDAGWYGRASFAGKSFDYVVRVVSSVSSYLVYLCSLPESCHRKVCIFLFFMVYWREAYSEPCQTSKIVLFAKIVNEWKLLTIFEKCSILDVWQHSEYSSAESKVNCFGKFYYILQ